MKFYNNYKLFSAFLLCLYLNPCCANPPCTYEKDSLLWMKMSESEVKNSEQELRDVSSGKIPEGAEGGILCDCEVLRVLPPDKHGQPKWLIRVKRTFVGAQKLKSKLIKVTSPTEKNGGAALHNGFSYRIFCIDISNKNELFEIHKGTVIELSKNDSRKRVKSSSK